MDWDSDLEDLLEERVSAVKETEPNNGQFMSVAEEIEDKLQAYDRENTLKHGTAVENLESISERGLRPGDENDSVAGERSDQNWVRMTHLFPAAVKYGEEAFPEREKIISKANDWAEFLGRNVAEWSSEVDVDKIEDRHVVTDPSDKPEGPLYGELYTHLVNAVEKLELIDGGTVDIDPLVVEVPYSSAEYVHVPWGEEHPEELDESRKDIEIEDVNQPHYPGDTVSQYQLLEKTENEVEAINQGKLAPKDPLQETKVTSANLDEDASIYVPHERLEEFRDKYSDKDFKVLSIEAKSLQHELRMEKTYLEDGKVSYSTPWDIKGHVINFDWEEPDYDERPEIIDISG